MARSTAAPNPLDLHSGNTIRERNNPSEPVDCLCEAFEVARSGYYAHRLRRRTPDVERLRLRSRVNELFTQGRSAPGSRSIMLMMQEEGEHIGRFKVRRLMRELELVSKQPGSHAYKKATVERPDIPNILNREFDVDAPNQVWCGDITYIWAQGKWYYLVVVLDLYARRVVGWALSEKPDADLVIKALDVAYEQRDKPQGLLFHSDRAARISRGRRQRSRHFGHNQHERGVTNMTLAIVINALVTDSH